MRRNSPYNYGASLLITPIPAEARFDSLTGEGVSSRYDGFGRLLHSTVNMDGVSRTVRSQYDRNGNRTQLTHPDGQVFTYAYDGMNRPLGIYQGTGTSVMLDLFAYNAQGLVGERTEPNGSAASYTYDPLGRLTSQTDTFAGGTGNVVRGFDYNPASQIRTGMRDNDAYAWTAHYASSSAYTTNGRNQYTIATPRGFAQSIPATMAPAQRRR